MPCPISAPASSFNTTHNNNNNAFCQVRPFTYPTIKMTEMKQQQLITNDNDERVTNYHQQMMVEDDNDQADNLTTRGETNDNNDPNRVDGGGGDDDDDHLHEDPWMMHDHNNNHRQRSWTAESSEDYLQYGPAGTPTASSPSDITSPFIPPPSWLTGTTETDEAANHSSSSPPQHYYYQHRNHNNSNAQTNSSSSSSSSSLDSGMAAVRKWIRSRSRASSTTPTSSSSAVVPPPPSSGTGRTSRTESSWRNQRQREPPQPLVVMPTPPTIMEDFVVSNGSPQYIVNATNENSDWSGATTTTTTNQTPSSPSYQSLRQRAHSEPDATSIRDYLFQRALTPQSGRVRRRRYQYQSEMESLIDDSTPSPGRSPPTNIVGGSSSSRNGPPMTPRRLSSSDVEILYSNAQQPSSSDDFMESSTTMESSTESSLRDFRRHDSHGSSIGGGTTTHTIQSSNGGNSVITGGGGEGGDSSITAPPTQPEHADPQDQARARWLRINRRFQVVITIVALIFSILLFCILLCWVVLASNFVASIDQPCDVPLKPYFWLVTAQMVLDIFRTEIMRLFLRWDTNSNQRIPCRVITYNTGYLMYAFAVLWLGIQSTYIQEDITCRSTARPFFKSSKAFVTLSIAAWAVIFLGYVLPFCFVATILTLNGYTPSNDRHNDPVVFPTPMGSPPDTMDRLKTVQFDELPTEQSECSVCMENFRVNDTIVKTECRHYYHRQCLADWLSNARTCPVCRMDIPEALDRRNEQEDNSSSHGDEERDDSSEQDDDQHNRRMGIGPVTRTFARNTDIHHEVMMMHHQIIRRSELRNRNTPSTAQPVSSTGSQLRNRAGSMELRNRARSHSFTHNQHDTSALEEGRER